MSELALGVAAALLSGGAVAVFSFLIARRYDQRKSEREHGERRTLLIRGLIRELESNRRSCSSNLTLLAIERRDLKRSENAGLVNPMARLETGAWALARVDLPPGLAGDEDLVGKLSIIAAKAREVNQTFDNRDLFHILHVSGDYRRLVEGLNAYAGTVKYPMEDLIERIDEALGELGGFLGGPDAETD